MAYMLREGNVTIVHCDGDRLRAIHGVQEFFALPSVTLDATYAVSRSGNGNGSSKITTAAATGETSTSRATSVAPGTQNGDTSMVDAGESGAGTGAEGTENGCLVGEELTKAFAEPGAEERYEQRWPFRVGSGAQDWEGRAYVLKHLLTLLGHKISSNTSPILLIPPPSPPSLPLPDQALWAQLAFEELNVPALSIVPASLATTYALGATSGIILNIGRSRSEITVITDSIIRWECSTTVQVGYGDCETWFESLLMKDEDLDKVLKEASGAGDMLETEEKRKLVQEVAKVIWTECTGDDLEVTPADGGEKVKAVLAAQVPEDDSFDVAKKLVGDTGLSGAAAAASHKSKKTAAAAATAAANKAAADAVAAAQADVISINIPSLPEKEIVVGQVRHRLCEPLLKGTERSGGDTVWEGMGRAVGGPTMSPGDRMAVWEGVGVVGELARIKSFPPALITYLTPFLLSSTDLPSDTQPARIRLLSIPDYFANFKGATTELAPFLGGTMVAKVAFSDQAGKHCITKVDYNAKGPSAVYSIFAEQDR